MALEAGLKLQYQESVTKDKTAKVWGSGDLDVYATPAMLLLMEKVSKDMAAPHLEPGMTTVGTNLEVKHISASPVGSEIICISELIEIDRKRLVFRVIAMDQAGMIGEGIHERFIVDSEKFLERAKQKI